MRLSSAKTSAWLLIRITTGAPAKMPAATDAASGRAPHARHAAWSTKTDSAAITAVATAAA
jgi:hypothetical protein